MGLTVPSRSKAVRDVDRATRMMIMRVDNAVESLSIYPLALTVHRRALSSCGVVSSHLWCRSVRVVASTRPQSPTGAVRSMRAWSFKIHANASARCGVSRAHDCAHVRGV